MKKLKFLSLALVFVLAVTVFVGCTNQTKEEKNTKQSEEQVQEEMEKKVTKISVSINYGDEEKSYKVDFKEGMTAYDALNKVVEQESLEIQTTEYDFGVAIDSIESREGGEDNKYWLYYINGAPAPVAVDKQELIEGMKVEFRFETSTM